MTSSRIVRSLNGCLTCKNRKKKCDETRPICTRCINGDFKCLGYDHLAIVKGPRRRRKKEAARPDQARCPSEPVAGRACTPTSPSPPVPDPQDEEDSPPSAMVSLVQLNRITRDPRVNRLDPDHIVQMMLFYSQQGPQGVQPFRSFPFSILHAMADRAKSSSLSLKATYVGTQIKKAILAGAGLTLGVRLIVDFQRQIYIGCLYSLAHAALNIVNTPASYSIFRKTVPYFLALTAKFEELWTGDLAISVRHALAHPQFEIGHFVFHDTLTSLVFGVIPLIHYDITISPVVAPFEESYIEWAHGCSLIVITLLARINSWRAARLVDHSHPTPTTEQQQEFLTYLQEWNPTFGYGDEPTFVMGRLAIQESWKHAVSIYLYMGMCGVDSADPRVEYSVHQVAQLSATLEAGHPLEVHITIPCIIAAAAARKEKHRAILRKKISISRNERICLIRGADFLLVLDHLWHGAAAGGHPTTWQDYVDSRFEMLPVEI